MVHSPLLFLTFSFSYSSIHLCSLSSICSHAPTTTITSCLTTQLLAECLQNYTSQYIHNLSLFLSKQLPPFSSPESGGLTFVQLKASFQTYFSHLHLLDSILRQINTPSSLPNRVPSSSSASPPLPPSASTTSAHILSVLYNSVVDASQVSAFECMHASHSVHLFNLPSSLLHISLHLYLHHVRLSIFTL